MGILDKIKHYWMMPAAILITIILFLVTPTYALLIGFVLVILAILYNKKTHKKWFPILMK